jgi:hypothetical protein
VLGGVNQQAKGRGRFLPDAQQQHDYDAVHDINA